MIMQLKSFRIRKGMAFLGDYVLTFGNCLGLVLNLKCFLVLLGYFTLALFPTPLHFVPEYLSFSGSLARWEIFVRAPLFYSNLL